MTDADAERLLLDTNIVVHIIRDDAVGRAVLTRFSLESREETPLISAVSLGEAEALAMRNGWGPAKRQRLRSLFHELVVVPIESGPVVRSYAELDLELSRLGQRTGQNDTWIAASAMATRSALVSADRDFLNVPEARMQLHLVDARTGEIVSLGGTP